MTSKVDTGFVNDQTRKIQRHIDNHPELLKKGQELIKRVGNSTNTDSKQHGFNVHSSGFERVTAMPAIVIRSSKRSTKIDEDAEVKECGWLANGIVAGLRLLGHPGPYWAHEEDAIAQERGWAKQDSSASTQFEDSAASAVQGQPDVVLAELEPIAEAAEAYKESLEQSGLSPAQLDEKMNEFVEAAGSVNSVVGNFFENVSASDLSRLSKDYLASQPNAALGDLSQEERGDTDVINIVDEHLWEVFVSETEEGRFIDKNDLSTLTGGEYNVRENQELVAPDGRVFEVQPRDHGAFKLKLVEQAKSEDIVPPNLPPAVPVVDKKLMEEEDDVLDLSRFVVPPDLDLPPAVPVVDKKLVEEDPDSNILAPDDELREIEKETAELLFAKSSVQSSAWKAATKSDQLLAENMRLELYGGSTDRESVEIFLNNVKTNEVAEAGLSSILNDRTTAKVAVYLGNVQYNEKISPRQKFNINTLTRLLLSGVGTTARERSPGSPLFESTEALAEMMLDKVHDRPVYEDSLRQVNEISTWFGSQKGKPDLYRQSHNDKIVFEEIIQNAKRRLESRLNPSYFSRFTSFLSGGKMHSPDESIALRF